MRIIALDSDDNPKKRPYLETMPALTDGEPTPRSSHPADRQQDKWRITPGFIICWVAILILQGTHFGSDKKLPRKMCGTWVKTDKCTNVRVKFGMKLGKYCPMCSRKQVTTELSAIEVQKLCYGMSNLQGT